MGQLIAPHRAGTVTPATEAPHRNMALRVHKENYMFDVKTVSMEWGGKTLTLETGRIARQADGAVLATYGETVVLCAVTAAKSVKEGFKDKEGKVIMKPAEGVTDADAKAIVDYMKTLKK